MFSHWYFAEQLPTWALLLEIVLTGVLVVLAGSRLSFLADKVADKYQLGGAWVGALLLATVTSLPEVVTGSTAVWVGQTDMAFAAIYGSCSFNIVLIVLFNFFIGGGSILHGKARSHTLSSSFGVVLTTLSLLSILIVQKFTAQEGPAQAVEVTAAVVIAATYAICMRMVYRTDVQLNAEPATESQTAPHHPHLMLKVALVSLVLVLAAWWLARTGDVLADHPIEMLGGPLGATVVGSLILAIATSLPEIATGLAAVRMGNLDMALGNIFGSNMFNIFVIPMLKIVSLCRGDSLLMSGDHFDPNRNLIAGLLPILLTGVVVAGLSYRSDKRVLRRFGVDSGLIAAIYVVGMYLLLSG